MSILEAFIIGLVQGLTEFLPVSSSGHTILAGKMLGLYEVPLAFELVVHVATLLALAIVLRKKLLLIVKKPLSKDMRLIITASIPTVIIVLIFRSFFEKAFNGEYLIYCFIITAVLILVSSFKPRTKLIKKEIGYFDAIVIGTAQGIAAMPGISRSGTTICAATLLGNDRESSATFSFLISIPIIIGSAALELITNSSAIGIDILPLIVGFFTAFVSGLISVKFLLKLLSKYSLEPFAIYLFLLSVFILLNNLYLHIF